MKHQNNFDLIRFLLAFIVFLVHAHVLSKKTELEFLSRYLSSDFAVKAFFVVSGYLIFMSYENSKSSRDYFIKRVRRIYPAYFAIVVICSFAGLALTSLPASDYFSFAWLKYLSSNLIFLNFLAPYLPGVFATNPNEAAVNGALWTLKIEVLFYLSVPLIVFLFRKTNKTGAIILIYIASIAYLWWMNALSRETGMNHYDILARQLPGQLAYFMSGAWFYYYGDRLKNSMLPLFVIALGLFSFSPFLGSFMPFISPILFFFAPFLLAIIIIYGAVYAPYLGNFGKHGDFSYGIYIIHFPILQSLIAVGAFEKYAFLGLLLATVFVLLGAHLSWHFIEKPFLKKSSHYVIAEQPAENVLAQRS